MGLYNDPGVIMGKKKKDSVIITKEVSRYTNEELVLKKDSHVTSGNVNSRKTGSKRVDKEREREGEEELEPLGKPAMRGV